MKIKKGEIKHTFKPKDNKSIDDWVGINGKKNKLKKLTVDIPKQQYNLLIAEASSRTVEKGEKVYLQTVIAEIFDKHFNL